MVVRLSRSKLAQICKAFDGGELGARSFYGTTAPTVFFVKNAGLVSINEGAPLSLSGFATSSLVYPKAFSRMNNGALVLAGTVPGSNVHAVALDRIAPGKIGRAASLGLIFHTVTINDASHVYADASFSSSASAAFYDIVAKSATSGGVAVCALYHAASGGGSPTYETVLKTVDVALKHDPTQDLQTGFIVPYISNVSVVNGALTFTVEYMGTEQTTTSATVVKSIS